MDAVAYARAPGRRVRGRRTRALACRAAGLLLAAGMIGAGIAIGAPSGYAAGSASLTVSPGEGSPDARFTVTYRWPVTRGRKHVTGCLPGQVTVEWDGSVLGRAVSRPDGETCVAALEATPPRGSGAGRHTVSVTRDASARATYLVTGSPTEEPSAGTVDSTDPPVGPQVPDASGVPADAAAPAGTGTPEARQDSGGGLMGWLISFGALLVVGGAGMFGFILWRSRRAGPEPAWDMDTRPVAMRNRAARRPGHGAHRRHR